MAATERVGLFWGCDRARVAKVDRYQSKDGEPRAAVRLEFWGGNERMEIDPEQARGLEAYEGKYVRVEGSLSHIVNKFGERTVFTLGNIAEVK